MKKLSLHLLVTLIPVSAGYTSEASKDYNTPTHSHLSSFFTREQITPLSPQSTIVKAAQTSGLTTNIVPFTSAQIMGLTSVQIAALSTSGINALNASIDIHSFNYQSKLQTNKKEHLF